MLSETLVHMKKLMKKQKLFDQMKLKRLAPNVMEMVKANEVFEHAKFINQTRVVSKAYQFTIVFRVQL
jgi:hypothetical protein